MSVATLSQVKASLSIADADTEYDAVIAELISGVSAAMARRAGRVCQGTVCLEKTSLVELISPEPRTQRLFLRAYPVVSIAEIKEAFYGDFDDADTLVENSDYQIDLPTGRLIRIGWWLPGDLTVRVTYPGGYTAAGDTPGAGETAMPDDLVRAAVRQVCHEFAHRADPGLTGETVQGASATFHKDDRLLPGVRDVCDGYNRKIG